jgi:hypothetical protein
METGAFFGASPFGRAPAFAAFSARPLAGGDAGFGVADGSVREPIVLSVLGSFLVCTGAVDLAPPSARLEGRLDCVRPAGKTVIPFSRFTAFGDPADALAVAIVAGGRTTVKVEPLPSSRSARAVLLAGRGASTNLALGT